VEGGANVDTHRLGCSRANQNAGGGSSAISDIRQSDSLALAAQALDDFRRLGAVDLELR
jgi:hypothetical protein